MAASEPKRIGVSIELKPHAYDPAANPEQRRVIGDRLGMIAGRHGDDAALALRLRERGELGARTALLE